MSRWFRYYEGALDDPKVQTLPAHDFKGWVNMLCVASRNDGVLPDIPALAFSLRMDIDACRTLVERLINGGLIDRKNGGVNGAHYAPHGWDKRQYKSDTSTARVKRFRERSETVTETPPETDTEADTEREEANASSARKRGSRLSDTWVPDEVFASREGLSAETIRREAASFRDYWRGVPGQRGVKVDWDATWRNWVRKAASAKQPSGKSPPSYDSDAAIYRNVRY